MLLLLPPSTMLPFQAPPTPQTAQRTRQNLLTYKKSITHPISSDPQKYRESRETPPPAFFPPSPFSSTIFLPFSISHVHNISSPPKIKEKNTNAHPSPFFFGRPSFVFRPWHSLSVTSNLFLVDRCFDLGCGTWRAIFSPVVTFIGPFYSQLFPPLRSVFFVQIKVRFSANFFLPWGRVPLRSGSLWRLVFGGDSFRPEDGAGSLWGGESGWHFRSDDVCEETAGRSQTGLLCKSTIFWWMILPKENLFFIQRKGLPNPTIN